MKISNEVWKENNSTFDNTYTLYLLYRRNVNGYKMHLNVTEFKVFVCGWKIGINNIDEVTEQNYCKKKKK